MSFQPADPRWACITNRTWVLVCNLLSSVSLIAAMHYSHRLDNRSSLRLHLLHHSVCRRLLLHRHWLLLRRRGLLRRCRRWLLLLRCHGLRLSLHCCRR